MKKRILSLALAVLMFAVSAPFAALTARAAVPGPSTGNIIPDPAFYADMIEYLGKADGDPILAADVEDITVLSSANANIKDLTGIEYFTALEWFQCVNNQLTVLDVSKNTALTFLSCFGNQLTALDVSGCTALTVLDCSFNQLTALDVSGCTALERLGCGSNQFTALDVSNNTALERLGCGSNQLTVLDVSNNTALERLGCDSNQLTVLDVSNNTALTELKCWNNQLTTLDVSSNTRLGTLWCWNNQLTALDVSSNTRLGTLWCWNNQLTALDVSKNTALTNLDCRWNFIEDKAKVVGFNKTWDGTNFIFDPQNVAQEPDTDPAPSDPLDSAAAWAREGITEAIEKGFVPADLQKDYAKTITRAEFCRMAVRWLEYRTGKTIDAILAERGLSRDPDAFSDVTNTDILAAYALGMVTGGGDGTFNPEGSFNRQSAALMIMNVCKALGDVGDSPTANFADGGSIANWAADGVNFCVARGIMSGTGSGNFDPLQQYSRQQSILAFNNINAAPPPSAQETVEREVMDLVNIERANNGLQPLIWDDKLAAVARAHSADMAQRGFFSHTNPEGLSPFDRMSNAGISYRTAAENIAWGQRTPEKVVDDWMNSSGHRANILNGNLTRIGVGFYEYYWTQAFTG